MNGRGWRTRSWYVPDAASPADALAKARRALPAGWYIAADTTAERSPTPLNPRGWWVRTVRKVGR